MRTIFGRPLSASFATGLACDIIKERAEAEGIKIEPLFEDAA